MKHATSVGFFPELTIVSLSPMIPQMGCMFRGCWVRTVNHCIPGQCKGWELENPGVDLTSVVL